MKLMDPTVIKPYGVVNPKVYGYMLPGVPSHEGYVKIGETERKVEVRVLEQIRTVGLKATILFHRLARKSDGTWFRDRDLHRFLVLNGIRKAELNRADEWFFFNDEPKRAEILTDKFIKSDYDEVHMGDEKHDYILRWEQGEAVAATLEYYNSGKEPREFLWNAKPRFGKTLTAYDFVRQIGATNVLIVTNRPAIANSWFDDFKKFIAWQEPHIRFISETTALKDKALTRKEYLDQLIPKTGKKISQITFISLQDLKGAKFVGGEYDKLEWVGDLHWDLLIIDEAHEGVDTQRTDAAFDEITRDFTLHLSGTPFKALASNKFREDQIFNWSYMDEQEAKTNWDYKKGTNPYIDLPRLNMFTYQMSKMIEERVSKGLTLDDETNVDFAFDLNEFFKVKENGRFEYEASVKKFLDNLASGKFPFAPGQHRKELNHTFWLLPRVNSAKALEVLLKEHPVFKEYHVVLAAGDGISLDAEAKDMKKNEQSLQKVREAIKKHAKTITLSVGQLTTGVTIPEWSAVLMLCNIKSPSFYFQAAFRAQNPYIFTDGDKLYRKENAYIFDFAPDRTLILFDEFANNLSGDISPDVTERKNKIKELLNFFPVIAEDEDGTMHQLDAGEALTIPTRITSQEVVRRGFMSNLLFANIAGIFSGNAILKEILEKLPPEKNKRATQPRDFPVTNPMLDEDGNVKIPTDIVINQTKDLFGPAIYGVMEVLPDIDTNMVTGKVEELLEAGFDNFRKTYGLTKIAAGKIKTETKGMVREKVEEYVDSYAKEIGELDTEFSRQIKEAEAEQDHSKIESLEVEYEQKKTKATEAYVKKINTEVSKILETKVEEQLKHKEEEKKKTTEDEVRARLRGFARTIPAFLMAYGNETTNLANFDEHVDGQTFKELTGITLNEFRMLRDGFDYIDEEGNNRKQAGVFNELVFNASIKEFFATKKRLSNYFAEDQGEDIFDYIPPQETNQIFTPRKVVQMMVDMLEENNPEIFSDYRMKFLDPYAKSGMYIAEIVKRLFEGLSKQIPNPQERLKWILENQVYALAPSNIIYNIVKNYVFSDFKGISTKNIIELDLVEYISDKEAINWQQVVQETFGGEELKFDVIIGNPPYQLETGGAGRQAKPIYHLFVEAAKKLEPLYLSMIIPSRWFAGGMGLIHFRKNMLQDRHIRVIVDYSNAKDCFPNISLSGGVCYFLRDRDKPGDCLFRNIHNGKATEMFRMLDEFPVLVRYIEAVSILRKILGHKEKKIMKLASSLTPFGLPTNYRGSTTPKQDSDLTVYSSEGISFISRNEITKGMKYIDNYNVLVSKTGSEHAGEPSSDGKYRVLSSAMRILEPGEICTHSYFVIGNFTQRSYAENLLSYLKTRLVRFLILQSMSSINVSRNVFRFVPVQNFELYWTDEKLYVKYGLTKEEIDFIESMIRPME